MEEILARSKANSAKHYRWITDVYANFMYLPMLAVLINVRESSSELCNVQVIEWNKNCRCQSFVIRL